MKFFSSTMALCLDSAMMAAPSSVEKRQGVTVIGSVGASIATLRETLPQYEAAIEAAVDTLLNASVKTSVAVIVAAEASLTTNLGEVVTALNATANAIADVTINAAGGVVSVAANLTQAEINQLQADIAIVQDIISGLSVAVKGTAGLSAAFLVAVNAELDQLRQVIAPLLIPIVALVNAVVEASGQLSVTVNGVQSAVSGLMSIVGNLYRSIGL